MSSTAPARRRPRPGRTAAVVAVLALGAPAALPPGPGPFGGPDATAATASRGTAKRPRYTVEGELRRLHVSGAITGEDRAAWRALYRDVVARAQAMPRGTARTELLGVAQNTASIAARRRLTAPLARSVFLTLAVNRDWWTSRPAPANGSRPAVPGSPLTWQYYRGEGLQIQWLATFGLANALSTTTTPAKLAQLRAIQDEAVRLASDRAGGPAWEYLFDFGGGRPPWASGMAQATAMQSLLRTSTKLGVPAYRDAGLRAVALLRRSSPTGARWSRPAGDHLLLYTFARTRVLNAFSQTVSALHEVAATTQDGKANAVYVRAERELRAELPAYDLGDWGRYSIGGARETPSYHRLSRDNLRTLCRVLAEDATAFAAGRPVAGARPPAPAEPYCAMARRYTEDLRATPAGPRTRSRIAAPLGSPGRDVGAAVADPSVSQP